MSENINLENETIVADEIVDSADVAISESQMPTSEQSQVALNEDVTAEENFGSRPVVDELPVEEKAEEEKDEVDEDSEETDSSRIEEQPNASESNAPMVEQSDVADTSESSSTQASTTEEIQGEEADSGFMGMSAATWLWGAVGVGAVIASQDSTHTPEPPSVSLATDTGIAGDGLTNSATFAVSGLEQDATWEFSTDGGTTWTSGEGDSFTITGEGSYSVVVRQEKGNVSENSSAVAVTIDTTAPDASALAFDLAANTVTISFDGTLNESEVPVDGEIYVEQNGSPLEITGYEFVEGDLVVSVAGFGNGPIQVGYSGTSLQDDAGNSVGAFRQIVVSDGYISGGQVYLDANNDGVAQESELLEGVTTDSMGQVFVGSEVGPGNLIITGGVNTDTGAVNTFVLSAPNGYTAVNPLTTLVAAVIANSDSEISVEDAENVVLTSLGIVLAEGETLSSYDPQQDTSANALDVQKAVAQVATVLSTASSGGEGAQTLVTDNIAKVLIAAGGEQAIIDDTTITDFFKDESGLSVVNQESVNTVLNTIADIDEAADLEAVVTSQAKATDTVAPVAAASIDLDSASDTGASDNITMDSTPTINVVLGMSEVLGEAVVSGDTLALYSGSVMVGSHVLTDADIAAGSATVTPIEALADGTASLTVKVMDRAGNMSAASSAEVVTIDTTGPTFTSGDIADQNENVAIGTVVYTASADDANSSAGITYSLKAGSDAALTINASSGEVSLLASPDHETATSHAFTVVATDAAGNSSEKALTLNIVDLDDSAPTITSGATATSIDENSGTGQVIYTATATDDGDISDGFSFSLKAGGSSDLSIDSSTGAVTLAADPDQDTTPSYAFIVIVTDAAGNMTEKEVTLTIGDLDDTAPTFTSSAMPTVDENTAAGQAIYTAVADDSADVSDGVTYSLKDGSDSSLSINAQTGVITTDTKTDFETKSSFAFTVVATDAAGNMTEQAVGLSVNDLNEAPTVTGTLADVTAVTGLKTEVDVTGVFTDVDANDTLTYSLASGDLPAGLTLTSSGMITGTATAESAQATYTIRATDSGGLSVDQTINLKSVSAPVVDSISVSNAANSSDAGTVDQPVNIVLTMSEAFTLDVTNGSPTIGVSFGDSATEVTATYVSTSGNTLTFSADAPAGNASSVALASISLNGATLVGSTSSQPWETTSVGQSDAYLLDNAGPSFTSEATAEIHEFWPVGTAIYTASSTDVSSVTYSLADGADPALSIDANTGAVTLDILPEPGSIGFTVVATDALGNQTEKVVAASVASGISVSGPGVISQGGLKVVDVDNGDGSYTLELYVAEEYRADFSSGIGSMDLVFNYTPDDFEAISAADVTSSFAFPLVNSGVPGVLVIGGFDLTPYQADSAEPVFAIKVVPTQIDEISVSFSNVIFDTTDMPSTSIVYGEPTKITGDAGSDAYILAAGDSEIATGDGSDVLVVTEGTGTNFYITDFVSGSDSIDFGDLLDTLGYTSTAVSGDALNNVAQEIVTVPVNIAELITTDDISLDNVYGAFANEETGVVTGFYDADPNADSVIIDTFELNIGEGVAGFSLDDVTGFIA